VRDLVLTVCGALLALLLAVAVLSPLGQSESSDLSRPRSQDRGDSGLHGLYRWLDQSGIPVRRLRERYDRLSAVATRGEGNLLILALPSLATVRLNEQRALHDWVARGNDVFVLYANASRPAWAGPVPAAATLNALELDQGSPSWSLDTAPICAGLFTPPPDESANTAAPDTGTDEPPDESVILPPSGPVKLKPHPADVGEALLAGIHELGVRQRDPNPLQMEVVYSDSDIRFHFDWLCDTVGGQVALRQFRLGNGRVFVSSYPEILSNRDLAEADNARFFSNLLGLSLRPGGAVIFDDMHQGDSALYDPAAFYGDPRLHASIGFALAIWLLYLLADASRFIRPPSAPSGVTPGDFAVSVGGFLARRLAPHEAGAALMRHFHESMQRRLGRTASTEESWPLLDSAGVDRDLCQQLRDEARRVQNGRRDLRPLMTLQQRIEEQLQ